MNPNPELQSPEFLLRTKLEIPNLASRVLHRARLTSLLQRPGESKVTILTASPGYGKTTLLGEWLSSITKSDHRTAWITLDIFDNAPFRFWAYVIAAIKKTSPSIKFTEESLLARGYDPLDFTRIVPLINEIGSLPVYLNFILDDYHVISDNRIHSGVAYLIEHQPKNMHLILSSRMRPEIPLARLRTLGRLVEITSRELSFSFGETRKYLGDMIKTRLTQAEIEEIYENTEGWIAGLQMTAITHVARRELHSIKPHGIGDPTEFREYFLEEVLNNQDPQVQNFLLKTSILNEFSPGLCNTLLEIGNSQTIIDQLVDQNLFIEPIDNLHTWYRYHPIFAKSLTQQLQKTNPMAVAHLHNLALDWFMENKFPEKAVIHALQSGQEDTAADIIAAIAMRAIINFDLIKLIHWINAIPDGFLAVRPRLGVFNAVAYFLLGQYEVAMVSLEKVENILDRIIVGSMDIEESTLRWEIGAVRAAIEGITGDHIKGLSDGKRLLQDKSKENNYVFAMLTHATAIMLERQGLLDQASMVYDRARNYGLAYDYFYGYFHSTVAMAHGFLRQGRLLEAEHEFTQALDFAVELNLENATVSLAQTGLLEIALEQNNISVADKLITEILQNFDKTIFSESAWISHIERCLAIADYFVYKNELIKAREYFARALDRHHDYAVAGSPYPPSILETFVRLIRAETKNNDSTEWHLPAIEWLDPLNLQTTSGQIIQARIYLNLGKVAEARELLAGLTKELRQTEYGSQYIQVLVLNALSSFKYSEKEGAFTALTEALQIGASANFTRVFLEEGEPMQTLLCEFSKSQKYFVFEQKNPGYVDYLMRQFTTNCSQVSNSIRSSESVMTSLRLLHEPLSERELDVLKKLLNGSSTKEIAESLTVSVNTAKTHIRNIFRKFGVHSRRMLINRAAELGLPE